MAEFGLPSRNVTQDANEGTIHPPTKKIAVRDQNLQRVKSDGGLSAGLDSLGTSLGAVLQERVNAETTHINEQRTLEASMRQGRDTAINESDKEKKRTGWKKYLFGESIEYRGAQQAAVGNMIQARYNQALTEVDEKAWMKPDEYEADLKTGLNSVLDKYAGDRETQLIASQAYNAMGTKLVAQQYGVHDAWATMQAAEQSHTKILTSNDTFTLEMGRVTNPEQAQELKDTQKKGFTEKLWKAPQQSDDAYRVTLNAAVVDTLKQGNINLYNAGKDTGWFKSLTSKESAALEVAKNAYDRKYGYTLNTVVNDTITDTLEMDNWNDMVNRFDAAEANLDTQEERLSGTEQGDKLLSGARLALARARKAAEIPLAKRRKAADIAIAQTNAWGNDDAIDRAAALYDKGVITGKKQIETADSYVLQTASAEQGEELESVDLIKKMYSDKNLAVKVSGWYENRGIGSDIVKSFTTQWIGGFSNDFHPKSEGGEPSEESLNKLQVAEMFLNNPVMMGQLSPSQQDNFHIIAQGIRSKDTALQIQGNIETFHKNAGDFTSLAPWPLKMVGAENRGDYLQNIVQQETGAFSSKRSLTAYNEVYMRALQMNPNDHKEASKRLVDYVKQQSISVFGKVIADGKVLDTLSEVPFEQVLKVSGENGILATYLHSSGATFWDSALAQEMPIMSLKDLGRDYSMQMSEFNEGLVIKSQDFTQDIFIPMEKLRAMGKAANYQKQLDEAQNDADARVWAREQLSKSSESKF